MGEIDHSFHESTLALTVIWCERLPNFREYLQSSPSRSVVMGKHGWLHTISWSIRVFWEYVTLTPHPRFARFARWENMFSQSDGFAKFPRRPRVSPGFPTCRDATKSRHLQRSRSYFNITVIALLGKEFDLAEAWCFVKLFNLWLVWKVQLFFLLRRETERSLPLLADLVRPVSVHLLVLGSFFSSKLSHVQPSKLVFNIFIFRIKIGAPNNIPIVA